MFKPEGKQQRIVYAGDKVTEYWDKYRGTNTREGFELIKMAFWGESKAYIKGKL